MICFVLPRHVYIYIKTGGLHPACLLNLLVLRSQSATISSTEEFLQLRHNDVLDEQRLAASDGDSLGVLNVMFDARLVYEEGVVQYHEVVILDAENIALKLKTN